MRLTTVMKMLREIQLGDGGWVVPLRLKLFVDFSLCVVADHSSVDEAAEIEAFGSELRHCVYVLECLDAIALTRDLKRDGGVKCSKCRGRI
jgi:hypothetical protein